MQNLLNELVDLLGIKVAPAMKQQHDMSLFKLVVFMQQEYPTLKVEEILLAYRTGIKGGLPDGDGGSFEMFAELNPRSFGKVMSAYKNLLREEAESLRILRSREERENQKALPETAPPTPEEQYKKGKFLFESAYYAIKAGKVYRDLNNLLYDWLYSAGRIPFSQERKAEMLQRAKQMVRNEKATMGATGNSSEHKKARTLAEIIDTNGVVSAEEGQDLWKQIYSQAKQIAFETLIKELIEMEITPEEFFSEQEQ
ncbi:hypothetical protein GCM10027347_44490 [Larkinella harenae]